MGNYASEPNLWQEVKVDGPCFTCLVLVGLKRSTGMGHMMLTQIRSSLVF